MDLLKLIALALLIITAQTFAQEEPNLTGEIALEKDEKKENSYTKTETETINTFEQLNAFMENPESAKFNSSQLSDNILILLNALYLQCSVNRGTCAEVLDAILEIDIIESLKTSNVQCKSMQRFWALWLENDMEKRQQYQVKTGYLQATSEFKNKVRPAYIKCIDTVAKQIESDAIDNTTFLKARYKEGSTPRAAVTEVLTSLKNAQRAKVNLLAGATSK